LGLPHGARKQTWKVCATSLSNPLEPPAAARDTRERLPQPSIYLTADEAASLDALVVRLEGATGVQIVPAIVGKCDSYPELPWKAFALAASLSALAVVTTDYLRPAWVTASTAVLHAFVILGAAALCALATIFLPGFARLLLRDVRAEAEVRQYAESLFLRRGLSTTRGRTGLLVLVSLFERRIEIVADTGFTARVTEAEWRAVIARMTPHFANARPFDGLRDALAAIEGLLTAKGFRAAPGAANELPDAAIEERGE
jgi:putative membrane protein